MIPVLMTNHPFSLEGRIALVTGSSRGLGLAMAGALAAAGARVVLNGRDAVRVEAAAAGLVGRGLLAETACFDVTDEAAAKDAVARIEDRWGALDILLANAGSAHRRPLAAFATADWRALLETHLTSAFVLAREASTGMVARRRGRIIVTASIMAQLARPTIPAYAAAKAGLVGLVRALACELGPAGVTANAIAPGYFATEINRDLMADPAFTDFIAKRTSAGRWGELHEIGGAAVFLASDAAAYVNGTVLFVDGGLTASL